MKRILAAMMIAMLMLSAAGICEELDLAAYTDAELTALYDQIGAELQARGLGSHVKAQEALYPGKYVVGTDIAAGRYRITCDENQDGMAWGLFVDEEGYAAAYEELLDDDALREYTVGQMRLKPGEPSYVTLTDGEVLFVSDYGWGYIEEAEPLFIPKNAIAVE